MARRKPFTPATLDDRFCVPISHPETPGLSILPLPSGRKSWQFRRRLPGSHVVLKLRLVMGNWIPGDPTLVAQVLKISAAYTPPPPNGFVSPVTWGLEANVRERFGAAGIQQKRHRLRARYLYLQASRPSGRIPRGVPALLRPNHDRVQSRRKAQACGATAGRTRGAVRGSEPRWALARRSQPPTC